jgi:hypothetical protein
MAMITFCLTLWMKKKVRYQGTLLDMLEFLGEYWSKSIPLFIKELFKNLIDHRAAEGGPIMTINVGIILNLLIVQGKLFHLLLLRIARLFVQSSKLEKLPPDLLQHTPQSQQHPNNVSL